MAFQWLSVLGKLWLQDFKINLKNKITIKKMSLWKILSPENDNKVVTNIWPWNY